MNTLSTNINPLGVNEAAQCISTESVLDAFYEADKRCQRSTAVLRALHQLLYDDPHETYPRHDIESMVELALENLPNLCDELYAQIDSLNRQMSQTTDSLMQVQEAVALVSKALETAMKPNVTLDDLTQAAQTLYDHAGRLPGIEQYMSVFAHILHQRGMTVETISLSADAPPHPVVHNIASRRQHKKVKRRMSALTEALRAQQKIDQNAIHAAG